MELENIILLAASKSLVGSILTYVLGILLAIVVGVMLFFSDIIKTGVRKMTGQPPPMHQVVNQPDFLRGAEDVFRFFFTPTSTEQELSAALEEKHVSKHTRNVLQLMCAMTLEEFQREAKADKPMEEMQLALIEKGVPAQLVPKLIEALLKARPDIDLNSAESQVQITIEDELENFTVERQELFLQALSGALGCPSRDLRITYLGRGSLVVELHFESDEALALFANEHSGNHPQLKRFLTDWKVQGIKLSPKLKRGVSQERHQAAVGGPTRAGLAPSRASTIFVSYSKEDKKYLDELKQFLTPYLRNEQLDFWSDNNLKPGDEWAKEIAQALENATVAILLVSPSFIASEFVREKELPLILERARSHDLRIFWVPLLAAAFDTLGLDERQAVHPTEKPLGGLRKSKRCEAWTQIARMISGHIDKMSNQAKGTSEQDRNVSLSASEELSPLLEKCSNCHARVLFLNNVCPNCNKAKAADENPT